ncbi:MAG: rRNA processing protein [Lichina confinis]|nr:MAG: rRNA processing protein [Lichina confinis]
MGSSAKKKKERKKDFQKTKLKAQVAHHLSLLNSHSDSQCRESLAYLTNVTTGKVQTAQPWALIIPKLLPLMTRASSSLRTQLIKLLRSIPPRDVKDNVQLFTTYIRSAMTSLSVDIRTDGIEILSWLLEAAGSDVVRSRDGWTKVLKCFVAVLGWDKAAASNGGRLASTARPNATDKATARQLQVLGLLLRSGIGCAEPSSDEDEHVTPPLWFTYQHLLPRQTNCFAHLDLFAQTQEEDELSCK